MYGLPSVPAMKQIISRVKNIATPFVNFFRPCGASQSAPFGAQDHSVLRTWSMSFAVAYAIKHDALWPPATGYAWPTHLEFAPTATPRTSLCFIAYAASHSPSTSSPRHFFILTQASFEVNRLPTFSQCPIAHCLEHHPSRLFLRFLISSNLIPNHFFIPTFIFLH